MPVQLERELNIKDTMSENIQYGIFLPSACACACSPSGMPLTREL